MVSWFASVFSTYLLCAVMFIVAGQLESECGILMKLESLEISLRDQKISNLEQDALIAELKADMTEKDNRIDKLQTAQSELEAEIANLKLRPIGSVQAVGFTARVPRTSQALTYTIYQMAFQTVVTNKGGAYNNNTGVFTCPVTGLYYFHAALLKDYNHDDWAGCTIYKNGVDLVVAHTQPGHSPQHGNYAAVTGVYTRMVVGDTITLSGCTPPPIEDTFSRHSSFTGFLVTPDG